MDKVYVVFSEYHYEECPPECIGVASTYDKAIELVKKELLTTYAHWRYYRFSIEEREVDGIYLGVTLLGKEELRRFTIEAGGDPQ